MRMVQAKASDKSTDKAEEAEITVESVWGRNSLGSRTEHDDHCEESFSPRTKERIMEIYFEDEPLAQPTPLQ